jgi:peptidoglycan-associated lipoprotein
MRRSLALVALALAFILACSQKKAATTVATAPPPPEQQAAEPPPRPTTPASPHIAVDQDLGKQCALQFANQQQAPKFDFDEFKLLPEDRDVLDQVASCITSGPLKGRKVKLVGRADPRGTEEYNLALGDRRAASVVDYLKHLGVSGTQVATSTRGDLDASGRDEAGWRIDRRVDIQLLN